MGPCTSALLILIPLSIAEGHRRPLCGTDGPGLSVGPGPALRVPLSVWTPAASSPAPGDPVGERASDRRRRLDGRSGSPGTTNSTAGGRFVREAEEPPSHPEVL